MKEKLKKLLETWVTRLQCGEANRFGFTPEEAQYREGCQAQLATCIEELREALENKK